MKYAFEHKPGHSAYDHFAREIISRAASEQRTTKIGMENALRRAWIAIRRTSGYRSPHRCGAGMSRSTIRSWPTRSKIALTARPSMRQQIVTHAPWRRK